MRHSPTDRCVEMGGRSTLSLAQALYLCISLSGCLYSDKPLIEVGDAVFPYPAGMHVEGYLVDEGVVKKAAPEAGEPGARELVIADGYYDLRPIGADADPSADGTSRFRLADLPEIPGYIMMMEEADREKHEYIYTAVSIEGPLLYIYAFSSSNVLEYLSTLDSSNSDYRRLFELLDSGEVVMEDTWVRVRSLEALKFMLPRMVRGGFHVPVSSAYRLALPDDEDLTAGSTAADDFERAASEVANERIDGLKDYLAATEERIRELCGGRVCTDLENGERIYRTDTLDPPVWYFKDGRLAPRELWP